MSGYHLFCSWLSHVLVTLRVVLCCSTETGVGLMKKGKTKEALHCFNRALQVDGENEETMVAKGAL